ncbi:MAG TPA: rRNA maturation RNase YbeY [Candidatus Udaeobacter sp.]
MKSNIMLSEAKHLRLFFRSRSSDDGDSSSLSKMTIPKIAVHNRQRKISLNVAELENFAGQALQHSLQLHQPQQTDLRKLSEIFIWLISDRRMALLHQKFLGQSGPTDVMTFQHGELFISVDTARRHAQAFENSLLRELKLYIVHGLLHLHGFDDQTPSEAHNMKDAQERILTVCSGAAS